MPETYTKEQIDEAKEWMRTQIKWHKPTSTVVLYHSIILSALSAAEQERDALKAQVAELEARLKGAGWISVKERLPEGIVLCIDKIDHIFFAQCRGGQWSDSSVTHWMPLPEPPAIVGKKEGV